mgnify:CR=1 FL=1
MFSTDCSVRAGQLCHASRKQSVVTLAGAQSSNTPAGKVARAVLFRHALMKEAPAFMLHAPNETMPVQLRHVSLKFVPLDRSNTGKVARTEQLLHALVKLVPEFRPVARKEVREVQFSHA